MKLTAHRKSRRAIARYETFLSSVSSPGKEGAIAASQCLQKSSNAGNLEKTAGYFAYDVRPDPGTANWPGSIPRECEQILRVGRPAA